MKRSRLNKYLRQRSNTNKLAYNKQRNYCVSLFLRKKDIYFSNIITKSIVGNKRFWKTIKSLFSDKNRNKETITLIENSEIISDELKVTQTFNYCVNIIPSLKNYNKYFPTDTDNLEDPISAIIEKN